MKKTNEGANAYEHSMNHALEFFSKAGSLFEGGTRGSYGNEKSAKELFIASFIVDPHLTMRLLFWLRDCRGGAGNRSGSKSIYKWLAENNIDWMRANMHLIPVHGRWDDLVPLFKTPLRQTAGIFWANAIVPPPINPGDDGGVTDVLAAKWAKRHYKPIRQALDMKESEFRKLLSAIRKHHIVEHKMCQKKWDTIIYKTVPSVAMARYTRAFSKHDDERFQGYKMAVKQGSEKVHADTLFPHDCIRTVGNGDAEMAELQFNALPDYMEGTDEKVMVICDTSGSMGSIVGGKIRAIDVSMGMALYCSSRVPTDSPFYKRFIGFSHEGRFVDWRKHTFKSALKDRNVFDGAIGSTRIDKALDLILKTAIDREISKDIMPTTLLIVSDMQFHDGTEDNMYGSGRNNKQLTEVERCLNKFADAGYDAPKIVYWNTAGYEGSQATVNQNVGLVSGFSPSICKAIFGGEDFSPMAIMMRAIEKYEVSVPEIGENVDMRV